MAAALAGSVALLGFGLDSAIEGLASVIIIWRFTGTRTLSPTAEAQAYKAVALTFFLLAPYITYDAVPTLAARDHAHTSWLGIDLAISSLIVMPILGVAKRRLGAQLASAATTGEGSQNLLCAYLATAVLIGLLVNTTMGWWWLDPLVGLGIAGLAIREGHRSLARTGLLLSCPRRAPASGPTHPGSSKKSVYRRIPTTALLSPA